MSNDLVARLRTVLERERDALRNGRIRTLEACLAEKEALILDVGATEIDGSDPEVAELRTLARSNAALCDAARRGVRAAIDRFRERSRVAGHLDTYDRSGSRKSFAAGRIGVPRRA